MHFIIDADADSDSIQFSPSMKVIRGQCGSLIWVCNCEVGGIGTFFYVNISLFFGIQARNFHAAAAFCPPPLGRRGLYGGDCKQRWKLQENSNEIADSFSPDAQISE